MSDRRLNPSGLRVRDSVLQRYPEWVDHVETLETGDVEIAVPAPRGSRAGHLVIFTNAGKDAWVRFAPPRACYCVESDGELHAVVEALLRDDAFFVVITDGDTWVKTSLLRPGEEPVLQEGQVANVVSWSGRHDKVVTFTRKVPSRGA